MSTDRQSTKLVEGRFDETSQKDVLELAARLQREHFDTMSASEIELAASEAGLNAEFVREAIRRIGTTENKRESSEKQTDLEKLQGSEWAVALGVPFVIAFVFLAKDLGSPSGGHVFALAVLCALAAVTVGFAGVGIKSLVDGKKRVREPVRIPKISLGLAVLYAINGLACVGIALDEGFNTAPYGLVLILCLAPLLGGLQRSWRTAFWVGASTMALGATAVWFHQLLFRVGNTSVMEWLIGLTIAGMTNGLASLAGFGVRSLIYKPKAESSDRADMLKKLFELQAALEAHREHRAFLSVDVVGSSSMKFGVSDLEVEHSFREYQSWVGETVRAFGGEIQVTAGDGAMAMFRDPASAVAAAQRLQQTVRDFNERRNRLAVPFAIRCGLSDGQVGIDGRTPLGLIQSPVLDRAAALQKSAAPGQVFVSREMIASAMPVLGSLRQVDLPNGDRAYVWP